MTLELMSSIQGFGIQTTLFGIPFFFSFWTLALAGFLSLIAKEYIEKQMWRFPNSNYALAGIGAGLTVALSVMIHEGAHAYIGHLCGLTTTHGGMSWWGAYVSFGVPLNTINPLSEIAIGLSGVLANAIIAAIATGCVWLLKESTFENAVQFVAVLNYRLAVLNLLPIIGLDGSKVADGFLRPFLPSEAIAVMLTVSTALLLPGFLGFTKKKSASPFEQFLEKI